VTAHRRPRQPVDLYVEHCKRVAAEAEAFIGAYGRGAWIDLLTERRAHQNGLDLLRLGLDAQVIADHRRPCVVDPPAADLFAQSTDWAIPLRTGGAA
jgi:hypothetical protein